MNAMVALLWIPCLATLPPPRDDDAALKADDLRGRVQTLVQPLLEKKQSAGVVFGVIEAGGTRVFGFGREALGGEKTPDGKTIFEIRSVTKVFTSPALAQMADQDTHLRRGVLPERPTNRDHTLRCDRDIRLRDFIALRTKTPTSFAAC
jgi:CubicO group peptidase (beta-lactamase class C family)